MIRTAASLVFLTLGTLLSQSTPPPRFEVAAINLTPADQWDGSSGGNTGKGKYRGHNRTLKRYIMAAYGVGPNQIAGGPPWLDSIRFDIDAKAEQPIDDDDAFMAMLQTLLAERFKLAIHRENKPSEAYLLVVAKSGPKLEKAKDGEPTTNGSHGGIDAQVITMKRFAEVLSRQMDFPVVDRTGLGGAFNLKLRWSPESDQPVKPGQIPAADSGPSIFTAIQQLGLRLQTGKTPVDVLVIDRVEMPSQN